MGLFDKRNKVEKVVDADKLIQNEIKLLTHEEQCELVSGKKDDWGSCEEHKISATPFAVANLAYQSSSYTTADGKPTTYAFSGSASSSGLVYCVRYAGDWYDYNPNPRDIGAPPALSLIFDPKSQADVAKKLVELTGKMNILNNSFNADKTCGELFLDWLMVFKKNAVTPRTFEGNIRNFNLHIKPYIGNMSIYEINTAIAQQLINQLLAKGLASPTVKKVKFLMNQFFEYACECEMITNNPTLKVKIRNRTTKLYDSENKYKAVPPEVRLQFVSALNQHPLLKPLCMTAMFAGLRAGELLALRWENIDFKNKTINVRCGITQVPIFDDKGKVLSRKTIIGDTKTACSVREVPIPNILVDALKDWKKEQWIKQQETGVDLLKPNAVVFCNTDGSVRTYMGTRHVFDRFARKYGFFGKIHFHTLRHTYSSMLFEANENPKIIQALLGHKSVKTTLTVYNSVDKSYYREATNKLNELFNSEKMAEYKKLEIKKDIPILNSSTNETENKLETDPEILMLEKLLAEKKAKKKQRTEEM